MRKYQKKIIEAYLAGLPLYTATMSTEEGKIYSYNTLIAKYNIREDVLEVLHAHFTKTTNSKINAICVGVLSSKLVDKFSDG